MSYQQRIALSSTQSNSRPTIGFISGHLKHKNSYTVWQSVVDAARERGANVISFFTRPLDTPFSFDAQGNVLYDLVNPEILDGVVVWMPRLTEYADLTRANQILDKYRAIPIAAIEQGGPEDIPWVDADNYQSMREAVSHLVNIHGYRRIAFVRGPDESHAGARARYQGYLDGLAEHGLPIDPDLISPPTEWQWEPEVGEAAIALFLDQRQADFDAVVAVNDEIASGAIHALQARGLHVPRQVAVVGYDDTEFSNSTSPPLTTLSLQGYEMGQRAVDMVLTLIQNNQTPLEVKLPPKLITRESCGCINPAVAEIRAGPVEEATQTFDKIEAVQKEKIVLELREAAGNATETLDPGWATQLLEAFEAGLKTNQPDVFLNTLGEFLHQAVNSESQVLVWAKIIAALRRGVVPYLADTPARHQLEDLWLQAQAKIAETVQLVQRRQALQAEQRAHVLNEVREMLITTFDMEGLMDILAEGLPRLGIPGCYLALYQDPQHPSATSNLLLAFDQTRGRLESQQQPFPSRELVPKGVLPQARLYNMVVEPLYFREEQLGFVLFEAVLREGLIYDMLRGEISSALRGALLVKQEEKRTQQLQTVAEVGTVVSTILDSTELRQQVVDLTKIRFDLYHAHIYLMNDLTPLL